MWKKIFSNMKCKKGSILAETIVGVAIYAIISIAFAAVVATASTLFLRAQVAAREWERVFVKMENKDYSTAVTESTEFNLVLKVRDGSCSIVQADGNNSSMAGSLSLSSVPTAALAKEQVFRRYQESVEYYATSRSDNTVYVYTIENK